MACWAIAPAVETLAAENPEVCFLRVDVLELPAVAAKLQERLRPCPPVLAPDEQIELAYKSGRDFIVFSTKRIMIIDRRGITGKKLKSKRCPLAFFRPYSTLASDI